MNAAKSRLLLSKGSSYTERAQKPERPLLASSECIVGDADVT
jgi:hypothetical protein